MKEVLLVKGRKGLIKKQEGGSVWRGREGKVPGGSKTSEIDIVVAFFSF